MDVGQEPAADNDIGASWAVVVEPFGGFGGFGGFWGLIATATSKVCGLEMGDGLSFFFFHRSLICVRICTAC